MPARPNPARLLPCLLACLCTGAPPGAPAEQAEPAPLFDVATHSDLPDAERTFDEVRDLILANYYSSTIDAPSLYHAAIQGMLRHVSPPDHRELGRLWSAVDYEQFVNALVGVRASVGVKSSFNRADGSLTVTEVLPGSPAFGVIEVHDRILRVDGEPLLGKSVAEVNDLLEGDDGSSVELTIVRDVYVMDVSLRRQTFAVQNTVASELPERIALIRLEKMTQNASAELRAALQAALAKDLDKVIVDVRGNQGGVFAEGMRCAEIFLAQNAVIVRTLRRGERVKTYVSSNPGPLAVDLVLLVDEHTASAAEVFVAALQSHGLARVVGTPTFGKSTMEETFTLANQYRVKFIVGTLYEPHGKSWYKHGLRPDLHVAMKEDPSAFAQLSAERRLEHDPQLRAAWTLLREHHPAAALEPAPVAALSAVR